MVDTRDLKSLARKGVWVQVPPGVQIGNAEIAQLVEHDLAKVGVASSSLVFRSKRESFEIMNDNIKVHVLNAFQ